MAPFSTRACGTSSATSSSGGIGSPASASDAPAASVAATGAKMSRPWKVADTGSRGGGEGAGGGGGRRPGGGGGGRGADVARREAAAEPLGREHEQAVVGADQDA